MRLPRLLLSTAFLIGACSTVPQIAAASPHSKVGKASGTILGAPSPVSTITGVATGYGTDPVGGAAFAPTYDTSIGNGVDANGYANLPLRAGDHRYFVHTSGSDANTCVQAENPATPKATVNAGMACRHDGTGDQVVLAEGDTFSQSPTINGTTGGFSLLYPTVIQSYDPTDPANEAKMGRAHGSSTHARPIITTTFYTNSGLSHYWAYRGLDFNPGNHDGQVSGGLLLGDGLLLENNEFRYQQIDMQVNTQPVAKHWVVRGNAIYGAGASMAAGVYGSGGQVTMEDNTFYHNGWLIGATRDDAVNGATGFAHGSCYCQHSTKLTFRRNLVADGSADAGSTRDDTIFQDNVLLDNPISTGVGGGNRPDLANPFGDALDFSFNGILSGNDVNSGSLRGWGITFENGKSISSARYNVLANNAGNSPNKNFAFGVRASSDADSYGNFDHNIAYNWSLSGGATSFTVGFPARIHVTTTNNIWDDPASGSNTNVATHTFSLPTLDANSLALVAGYASYAAMMQYAIDNPDARIQRGLLTTIMGAYGIAPLTVPLVDLAIGTNAWRTGNIDAGPILNVQDGDTVTVGGTWPGSLTWDTKARMWFLDGTATTASSGTGTLTENRPTDLATRTTTFNWTLPLAPQLSSLSVSPTSATTATANITTSVGDGTLYWVAPSASQAAPTVPDQPDAVNLAHYPGEVKGDSGFNNINYGTNWAIHGSQAVTSSGVQTINITTSYTGETHYLSVMQVAASGVWSSTVDGRYTIGPAPFTPTGTFSGWSSNSSVTDTAHWALSGTGSNIATASPPSVNAMVAGAGIYAGGARYFEAQITGSLSGSTLDIGVCNNPVFDNYGHQGCLAYISDGRVDNAGSVLATGSTFGASGHWIGVLADAGKLYFQLDCVNQAGSSANARTGGFATTLTGAVPDASVGAGGAVQITLNTGGSAFHCTVPTGASPWG